MNILVLGGDGFLGSHFVEHVVSKGFYVSVFGRFPEGKSKNLEHLKGKVDIITGDFSDKKTLALALKGCDIVYNFIGATNPAASWKTPHIEIDFIKNSVQFAELAIAAGVKKIVFPSSGGAIYEQGYSVITEQTLTKPLSPYGISRLTIENFLYYFKKSAGIAVDVYRIGNAYGMRQPVTGVQGVLAKWMHAILENRQLDVYGGRDVVRDYVFAPDIAYLMTHSLNDIAMSDVYNLGTGKGISILDLLELLKSLIDTPFRYRLLAKRDHDSPCIVLDSSKLLSFFPKFSFQSLEVGIQKTWEHFQNKFIQSQAPLRIVCKR